MVLLGTFFTLDTLTDTMGAYLVAPLIHQVILLVDTLFECDTPIDTSFLGGILI